MFSPVQSFRRTRLSRNLESRGTPDWKHSDGACSRGEEQVHEYGVTRPLKICTRGPRLDASFMFGASRSMERCLATRRGAFRGVRSALVGPRCSVPRSTLRMANRRLPFEVSCQPCCVNNLTRVDFDGKWGMVSGSDVVWRIWKARERGVVSQTPDERNRQPVRVTLTHEYRCYIEHKEKRSQTEILCVNSPASWQMQWTFLDGKKRDIDSECYPGLLCGTGYAEGEDRGPFVIKQQRKISFILGWDSFL